MDYRTIFQRVCSARGLELPEDVFAYIVHTFYSENHMDLAAFHPKFIVEHVIAVCEYEGLRPQLTLPLVKEALQNLLIVESSSTIQE